MKKQLEKLSVVVNSEESLDSTIKKMAQRSREVKFPGLAIVQDDQGVLQGIMTDGDIRRAYASDFDFSRPVKDIMITDPVVVPHVTPETDIAPEMYRRVKEKGRLRAGAIRHVLLVDEQQRLVDIYDYIELVSGVSLDYSNVAVYGMGHVGLTLAVVLANNGHTVVGIEQDPEKVAVLQAGDPYFDEPGLVDMLRVSLKNGAIQFDSSCRSKKNRVYIVAVGTPITGEGTADLSSIEQVANDVGAIVKGGDLVMLRSTVPVGTTREMFVPIIEGLSGLKAGEDFSVGFTPERVVEGRALNELLTIPQVVGGLTKKCLKRASSFWTTVSTSVVKTPTLEAAELVKLANNTFRDISFAFANELALIADQHNINAFELIQAANEGYPRNPIASPSPGVGGYCLTKDPVLLSLSNKLKTTSLGMLARETNARAAGYPVSAVTRFSEATGLPVEQMTVLVIGLAFKGEPETTDVRGSTAIESAHQLQNMGATVLGWDAVVGEDVIREHGIEPVDDLPAAFAQADAVLILNNHRKNTPTGLFYSSNGSRKLLFDGWGQIDAREIERVPGLIYATMGYMTPF